MEAEYVVYKLLYAKKSNLNELFKWFIVNSYLGIF